MVLRTGPHKYIHTNYCFLSFSTFQCSSFKVLSPEPVTDEMNTIGSPTRPTSARIFSSKTNHPSSPGSPGVNSLGVRLVGDLKFSFPSPPAPPLQRIRCSPFLTSSNKIWELYTCCPRKDKKESRRRNPAA